LPFSALKIFSTPLPSTAALDADAGTGMGVATLVAAVAMADTATALVVSLTEIGAVVVA
jgi:hypothetical protein